LYGKYNLDIPVGTLSLTDTAYKELVSLCNWKSSLFEVIISQHGKSTIECMKDTFKVGE